jgi:hypothetical protein
VRPRHTNGQPAEQPRGAHYNEIHVASHELRELVAVMPAEGCTKGLWEVVNRLPIQLGSGVS